MIFHFIFKLFHYQFQEIIEMIEIKDHNIILLHSLFKLYEHFFNQIQIK